MPTILLVEDEHLLRHGVQEVLELHDFHVIGAGDGVEALEWLEQTAVDLVITDLVMPHMDGVDFVRKLREKQPDLPVIVVSGSSKSVMERYGINTLNIPGANASLPKPFKSSELVALVNSLLSG